MISALIMTRSSCTKEKLVVETQKGTYTFPHNDFVLGRCAAEKKCTELDSILAPFTDRSEFDAVMSAVHSCDHKEKFEFSHVGLNIAEDNSTRVFSNGAQFDYKLHGDLYRENERDMLDCPQAYFNPLSEDKLDIWPLFGCRPRYGHYVCFKPKKVENVMVNCCKDKLVVETEKGTYTFPHNDKVATKCAAEKKCTKLNSILAPFTDMSEILAVQTAVTSCCHKDQFELSFVGLNIVKGDPNAERYQGKLFNEEDLFKGVFSNGVKFDWELHSHLYNKNDIGDSPQVYYWPQYYSGSRLNIWSHDDITVKSDGPQHSYVCFKPKNGVKSEAISGDAMDVSSNFRNFGGLFQFAIFCLVCFLTFLVCFLFIQNKKFKSKKSQQMSDLD